MEIELTNLMIPISRINPDHVSTDTAPFPIRLHSPQVPPYAMKIAVVGSGVSGLAATWVGQLNF
jgi:hypothetical protein